MDNKCKIQNLKKINLDDSSKLISSVTETSGTSYTLRNELI